MAKKLTRQRRKFLDASGLLARLRPSWRALAGFEVQTKYSIGRQEGTLCFKLHHVEDAPGELSELQFSVTIWPAQRRPHARLRLAEQRWRRLATRELRAIGYRGRWEPMAPPSQDVFGDFWLRIRGAGSAQFLRRSLAALDRAVAGSEGLR